ncbi:unnamed protein product [Trichobilharzia regenti]|nr:unnamed protein product [Trichobilharzia regenti]
MGTICVPETFDNQILFDLFLRPRNNFDNSLTPGNQTVSINGQLTASTITAALSLPLTSFVIVPDYIISESIIKLPPIDNNKYVSFVSLCRIISNGIFD